MSLSSNRNDDDKLERPSKNQKLIFIKTNPMWSELFTSNWFAYNVSQLCTLRDVVFLRNLSVDLNVFFENHLYKSIGKWALHHHYVSFERKFIFMIDNFILQHAYGNRIANGAPVPHEIMGCALNDGPPDLFTRDGRSTELKVLFCKLMFAEFLKRKHVLQNKEEVDEEEEKFEGELQECKAANL